jgi:hypothetical protein
VFISCWNEARGPISVAEAGSQIQQTGCLWNGDGQFAGKSSKLWWLFDTNQLAGKYLLVY